MAYKLLLADDSVTIQRVIELTFADEDIQVTAVGDGQQAIERIRAEAPDIVLADVGMPERDGFEVAAFVKQTPELSHIPVLLLTGAFEPVDENRVREVGCDGVLAKPFEPQLLIARVKQLLTTPANERKQAGLTDVPFDDQPLQVPATPAAGQSLEDLSLTSEEAPNSRAAVDEYFDRLDAAFATMAGSAEAPAAQAGRPVEDSWPGGQAGDSWGSSITPSVREAAPSDVPASAPAPQPLPAWPAAAAVAAPAEIATAFDWLLAAEQGQAAPVSSASTPGALPAGALEKLVDEVTRRVVERLADRAVRDQAAEIVSQIAERLVREEIERLKALK